MNVALYYVAPEIVTRGRTRRLTNRQLTVGRGTQRMEEREELSRIDGLENQGVAARYRIVFA